MNFPTPPTDVDPSERAFHASLMLKLKEMDDRIYQAAARIDGAIAAAMAPAPAPASYIVPVTQSAIAADTTLGWADLGQWLIFNCTAPSVVTLPAALEGAFVYICNVGAATLTVQDASANVLCALTQSQWTRVHSYTDSSNVPAWPVRTAVVAANGRVTTTQDITFTSAGVGVVLKDTGGHYWLFTVSTGGAITSADLGTTAPVGTAGTADPMT